MSHAKSNAERQADFRKRHPGYYQRLHAQRRAAVKALSAQRIAAEQAAAAFTIPLPTWRLALPAPVEVLVFPGLQTIEALCVPARGPLTPSTTERRSPTA